jgi:hypothetical protein
MSACKFIYSLEIVQDAPLTNVVGSKQSDCRSLDPAFLQGHSALKIASLTGPMLGAQRNFSKSSGSLRIKGGPKITVRLIWLPSTTPWLKSALSTPLYGHHR